MLLSVNKHITQKKPSPLRDLINMLILVVAVPVVIIAVISLSIYYIFLWISEFFRKKNHKEPAAERYHFELDLINNDHIRIIMVEDELDLELTQLNEAWMEKVNPQETCLYRVRTIPVILVLEGTICCFYCKEHNGGVLLQALTGKSSLSSNLVFLDYQTLEVTTVDQTGAFFLYNDDKNAQLIRGFNRQENIRLEIINVE